MHKVLYIGSGGRDTRYLFNSLLDQNIRASVMLTSCNARGIFFPNPPPIAVILDVASYQGYNPAYVEQVLSATVKRALADVPVYTISNELSERGIEGALREDDVSTLNRELSLIIAMLER